MLKDQGHEVLAIDNRIPQQHLYLKHSHWITSDFVSEVSLDAIVKFEPGAIIHCAGTSLVGPSVTNPSEYYENNFVKTKRLLDFLLVNKQTPRIIFSSSASTYGEPIMVPCQEEDPPLPVSPYGESKLMVEWMLESYHRAYGLDYVSFRYFNACGADPQGRHGQEPGATHIIARVLESICNSESFTLYGDNYPTPDGTCIRDYIHVDDLARAHVMAMDASVPAGVYNLGTSSGHSNQEIVTLAEKITGQQVDLKKGPIRAGDPAVLTASADKFNNITGWVPGYNIEEIISHVWAWYNR
jgi:UDP-glucose 4-epimerase